MSFSAKVLANTMVTFHSTLRTWTEAGSEHPSQGTTLLSPGSPAHSRPSCANKANPAGTHWDTLVSIQHSARPHTEGTQVLGTPEHSRPTRLGFLGHPCKEGYGTSWVTTASAPGALPRSPLCGKPRTTQPRCCRDSRRAEDPGTPQLLPTELQPSF